MLSVDLVSFFGGLILFNEVLMTTRVCRYTHLISVMDMIYTFY